MVYIVGRENEKYQTSVKDKTLAPKWNEVITLSASSKDVLHICVFDHVRCKWCRVAVTDVVVLTTVEPFPRLSYRGSGDAGGRVAGCCWRR